MNEKIVLEMTREHAQTVMDACEMLMRLKLGQTSYPTELMLGWPLYHHKKGMSTDEYCMRRDIANDILRAFLRATGNAEGTEKDMVENMAYEVWGTIRYGLYMAEHPDGGEPWSVASQPPLSESGLRMPECRVEEYGCQAIRETDNVVNFADVENKVSAWAARNPEPVYPTWVEWLCEQGLVECRPSFRDDGMEYYLNSNVFTPIPADIVQKLGLSRRRDKV